MLIHQTEAALQTWNATAWLKGFKQGALYALRKPNLFTIKGSGTYCLPLEFSTAFAQSCLLLEKTSPLKADMNLQRQEVMKPGAENKCQLSSFFHLVIKSLIFPIIVQQHI